MHPCPGPGCGAQVARDQLACKHHWYMIPKPLRDAVWSAWQHGKGAGSPAHLSAVATAINWLVKPPSGR